MFSDSYLLFSYNCIQGMESVKQIFPVKDKLSFVFNIVTDDFHCHCEPLEKAVGSQIAGDTISSSSPGL